MITAVRYLFSTFFVTLLFLGKFFGKAEMETNETDACECGMSDDFQFRIVGGEEVKPNSFPWMALILKKGKIHCGGTLINDKFILTAGHCLKWSVKEHLKIALGIHRKDEILQRTDASPEIEMLIIHENFTSFRLYDTNDIALIKLKNSVTFTDTIRPICLHQRDNLEKKQATVLGWGKLLEGGPGAKSLRGTNLTILSNEECKETEIGSKIIDSMLCAIASNSDACQGDSGGPLIYNNNNIWEIIGVVSWGIGCATPGIPGVYTRITKYLDWIHENTKEATYCRRPTPIGMY